MLLPAGCWTPPVANVQPKGEPRLIQSSIVVQSVKQTAVVRSLDAAKRTIVLQAHGEAAPVAYAVGSAVANLDQIRAGDQVQATVAEELAVYVLRDGKLPGPNGTPQIIVSDARVLLVDTSYRLLTLQYPNGRDETFKVGLDVRLGEMEAGDDVVIRTLEVVALVKKG